MTLEIHCKKISEPTYYHREHKNEVDEKDEASSLMRQCQRVATVALPFFALYKPLALPISLAKRAFRTFSSANQLVTSIKQGNSKKIPYQLLQTTIAIVALVSTIFAHPVGMLITTGHSLMTKTVSLAGHLQKGECREAFENCAGIIQNVLRLALFTHGGIGLKIASLAMQIILRTYHSHNQFRKGNDLEAVGDLLMSMVRSYQLVKQVKIFNNQKKLYCVRSKNVNLEGLRTA